MWGPGSASNDARVVVEGKLLVVSASTTTSVPARNVGSVVSPGAGGTGPAGSARFPQEVTSEKPLTTTTQLPRRAKPRDSLCWNAMTLVPSLYNSSRQDRAASVDRCRFAGGPAGMTTRSP